MLQVIPADVEGMDTDLRTMLGTQVLNLKQLIESIIASRKPRVQ